MRFPPGSVGSRRTLIGDGRLGTQEKPEIGKFFFLSCRDRAGSGQGLCRPSPAPKARWFAGATACPRSMRLPASRQPGAIKASAARQRTEHGGGAVSKISAVRSMRWAASSLRAPRRASPDRGSRPGRGRPEEVRRRAPTSGNRPAVRRDHRHDHGDHADMADAPDGPFWAAHQDIVVSPLISGRAQTLPDPLSTCASVVATALALGRCRQALR